MRYKERVLEVLQEMEEPHGPELEEYIEILEALSEDMEERLTIACLRQCKDIKIDVDKLPKDLQHLAKGE